MIKTGNKLTLKVPICRYSQTMNKSSKNTVQILRTEILDSYLIKNETGSNPALKVNNRRDFHQERGPACKTLWLLRSEKTDHVPSSQPSGVH
jgi:hypothetical protein